MTIRKLDRSEWNRFCAHASRGLIGKHVEIFISSMEIGVQLYACKMPLMGISYDPKSDLLEIIIGELDHLIRAPRELYVDEELLGPASLQIIDAEGVRQIITLRDPLMLSGPHTFRG